MRPPERCNRSSVPWAMPDMQMRIPNAAHWPVTQLGDVCALISRGTAPVYVERSDVMAIGQRCVTVAGFDAGKARPHSHRAMRGVVEPACGDVLLNSTGTGTIGRSCVFRHKGQFVLDGHVTVLRPNQARLDGRWLNAILRSVWGQSHLERFCFSGSTNQVELNRVPLATTGLPLPPVHEQRLAAKVLDTLDTTIRQTEAIIDKLKQVKQGLLHDLLTRGIADNGELRPPQCEAPHLYKVSALGWIPNSWGVLPMKKYMSSDITYGIVQAGPHIDEGVPYIRTGDMSGDQLVRASLLRTSRRIADSYARSEVRSGDIVMAIRATVGKVLPVPDNLDGANLTQGTARLAPNMQTDPIFLLWAIRHQRAQDSIQSEIKGTTFAEITLAALREVLLAAPGSLEEQRAIGARVGACENLEWRERAVLEKLKAQKSGLMDDLLTGRVRVTPLLLGAPA